LGKTIRSLLSLSCFAFMARKAWFSSLKVQGCQTLLPHLFILIEVKVEASESDVLSVCVETICPAWHHLNYLQNSPEIRIGVSYVGWSFNTLFSWVVFVKPLYCDASWLFH
jgi:hypothetical protein